MKTEYTRNNQPHIQHIGAIFSVTLLSYDAVPKMHLEQMRAKRNMALFQLEEEMLDEKLKHEKRGILHRQYDQKLEKLLHEQSQQVHPFSHPNTANCILEKIRAFDGTYYILEAACVMSNHVHILLDFSIQVPDDWNGISKIPNYQNLASLIGQIKGSSSFAVNKMMNRTGSLWMPGYHDRYIRSAEHYHNVLNYIIQNPVKAGIVKYWKDYKYTYLHPRFTIDA